MVEPQDEYTALMRASEEGHVDNVKLLLGAGADKELRNKVRG
jgi:ankyrin repeat protein